MAFRISKGELGDNMPNAEGRHTALHVGKELELGQRVFWVYVGAVVVSLTFVVLESSSAMSMPLLRVRRRSGAVGRSSSPASWRSCGGRGTDGWRLVADVSVVHRSGHGEGAAGFWSGMK